MHHFLGKTVRDRVTGFTGICTGMCHYLYGCNQFNIVPPANISEGKLGETYWFDEGRIEVVGKGISVEEVKGPVPGGPNREAPGRQA